MKQNDITIIPTGCGYDCGARCFFRVHVKDGKVIRVESDTGEEPQIRACVRCRAYRQMIYAPDRIMYPMKRVGIRGEGNFKRISWDEALDTVAEQLFKVKENYGPSAIFCLNVMGATGSLHGYTAVYRLLNTFGGYVRRWGNPSVGAGDFALQAMYGTQVTGNTQDDHINSRLIILWGDNPAITIQNANTSFYLAQAREAGARIICIDPRFTESASTFADQWIPIRPGTDVAMMIAMAYVIIKENLQDQKFLDKYTTGFDKFKDYVMGAEDGVPKTPYWAESITQVTASTIEKLASEYASTKPAVIRAGRAPARTAYGESFHRAAATLQALTGNIGVSGGGAGGVSSRAPLLSHKSAKKIPEGENPIEGGAPVILTDHFDASLQDQTRVNTARIWDAILKGKAGGYPTEAKLLYIVAHDVINQVPDVNKGVQALSKPEFIVVHDVFMTPIARFADILLPVNTFWERNDYIRPGSSGSYHIYANKTIESLYESKSDYEICCELAPRLGITNYNEGKTEDEWIREIIRITDDLPEEVDYETFKREGIQKFKIAMPVICFKKQIEDPENNPFPTPSGKIEIYSRRIAELGNPKLPPISKYMETWESINDPLAAKYPLQCINFHFKTRSHSCFDNIPWLRELETQTIWINSIDARVRGINDGDEVRIFNDRGTVILPAKVTERILPGVVAIGEGAWYKPDEAGIDRGGCANVLTRDEPTPGGGVPYNTNLVQVCKS
jgi:anaerobic dimethyl sulfoxide reductase subunit A